MVYVFFYGGVRSVICAILSYVFVEKAAMEARTVFVHKLSSQNKSY
jgi:peptidoglycan/LPS O-acetylase OafA/YrhL